MTRVSLSRLPGDRVRVVDGDAEREVELADLPAYVRKRDADTPRWVWDDTARWYPSLLAAGVRVSRCHDLRLGHHLLRRAPAVDRDLLAALVARLDRRMDFDLAISDGTLYLSLGEDTLTGTVQERRIAP